LIGRKRLNFFKKKQTNRPFQTKRGESERKKKERKRRRKRIE
jgi:hypothetical protein